MENQKIADKLKEIEDRKSQLRYKEKILKNKGRKIQAKRLIQLSSVLKKCGIDTWDIPTLLGACLELKERGKDLDQLAQWKEKGEGFNQKTPMPLIVIPTSEAPDSFVQTMKDKNFKWNKFRKEWYGYGVKEEIEELVKTYKGRVDIPLE